MNSRYSPATSDYRGVYRYLVFNGATRSQTVTVTIQDDGVVEPQSENFFLDLRTSDSAVILGLSTITITIEDDDSKLTHSVS